MKSEWVRMARLHTIEQKLWGPRALDPRMWWGVYNAHYCKSGENKNCFMAMCRSAKNKKRVLRWLRITQAKMRNRILT